MSEPAKNLLKVVIIFPYSGFNTEAPSEPSEKESQEKRKENFERLVQACCKYDRPVVIMNKDTVNHKPPKNADQFFKLYTEQKTKTDYKKEETFEATIRKNGKEFNFDVYQVWAVDTCQMWLGGWGHIIDSLEKDSKPLEKYRIIQIPGDLDTVGKDSEEKDDFFEKKLDEFINNDTADIVIGDYTTGSQFSSKDIIDIYGIFPLLANWFPHVSDYLLKRGFRKPRSEFLNLNLIVLKKLLQYPKFAYEQTLNMIIRLGYSLEYEDIEYPKDKEIIEEAEQQKAPWDKDFLLGSRHSIERYDLGHIKDDPGFRDIQSCFDQIERTERLLKRLWRQLFFPSKTSDEKQYREFLDEYDRRIQRSEAIIQSARIMIRTLLGKEFNL